MLSLNMEYELNSPRDFPPLPSKIVQNKETYPVYLNPKTGDLCTCILWAVDRQTGYEYYAFGKVKGSFKNKKSLVYRGWKMEETSFMSEFPRAMFTEDRYHVVEDPQELGSSVLPPQYRTMTSGVETQWKRVTAPFF